MKLVIDIFNVILLIGFDGNSYIFLYCILRFNMLIWIINNCYNFNIILWFYNLILWLDYIIIYIDY